MYILSRQIKINQINTLIEHVLSITIFVDNEKNKNTKKWKYSF